MAAFDVGAGADRRRSLLVAGALVAALVLATVVVAGPPAAPLARDLGRRLAASLIGGIGLLAAVRVFRSSSKGTLGRLASLVLASGGALLVWTVFLQRSGVRSAFLSVTIAVVVSATLFVGANRWLDQLLVGWARFTALTGTFLGAALAAILVGNRAIGLFVGTAGQRVDRSSVLVPVLAVLAGAFGLLVGRSEGRVRLLVGVVGGAVLGGTVGAFLRVGSLPRLEVVSLVGATLVLAAVGAVVGRLRGRPLLPAAVTGAAVGWLLGGFGFPDLGAGTSAEGLVAAVVLGGLVGLRLGLVPTKDVSARLRTEGRLRAAIFLAPAMTFISATLIIPTIRTIYLSLLDRSSVAFVGLANYRFAFRQPSFFNIENWRSIFSSTEALIAATALALAGLLALRFRRTIDGVTPRPLLLLTAVATTLGAGVLVVRRAAELPPAWVPLSLVLLVVSVTLLVTYLRGNQGNSGLSGGAGGLVGIAGLMLAFAVFSNLRGTLFNNLWWVVTVTTTATVLGLAIAALADRARGETIAKSIIFMPMAVSFVGAGIIWRFMYIARPENRPQTGVLNALWVGVGMASVSPQAPRNAAVLLAIAAGFAVFGWRALRAGAMGTGWGSVALGLWFAWIGTRFLGGQGVAGVQVVDGVASVVPLLFITGTQQVGAYNNLFIMVPFIWIYTGFAMVIFSAAIKGVPADLLEAGRVDGASESQAFWRIVLPQIRPTIGVVITTIIVVVMKVFDIVKVMTNGNFGTQVLANEMWNRAFQDGNFGVGSAIAVMLFLSVLPVMFINIRRMQKEAA